MVIHIRDTCRLGHIMVKILLKTLMDYIDSGYVRTRSSDGKFSIVCYEITNKDNIKFTRIDIFTRAD